MKLSSLLFVSISFSLFFFGCRKDEIGSIPSVSVEIMSTVDLTGVITDPDGNPVSDATVQYNLREAITDISGHYILEDVQVSSEHSSLQVLKQGYFSGSRTFRSPKEGTAFHRVTLIPLGTPLSFSGGNGTVQNNLVSINFPENSVKEESTGNVYTGEVEVYIKHIGTDEFSMPGDLTAINENDELEVLHSYGMVFVELYSDDGRKLNIADGMTANMTYEIPQDLLASAPETIKMWWYDYNAGVWREGGEAIRDGSRWVGEVSHFSCWNFDLNVPSIVVSGQIVQTNGGMSEYYVTFLNNDGRGGRGSAYVDGSFSGRVEASVPLEFTIRYFEGTFDTIVYQETVGPFDQDVDLGDIIINTDDFPSVPVALFTASQDATQATKYSFTNNSSVSGIPDVSFSSTWDFGGDGSSTEDSPTHTFSAPGLYDITLTITAADGEVATVTQTIDAGGISNKHARITDSRDDDTGELRLTLDQAILTGRLTFRYKVSEGQEMDIKDAFISVLGNQITGDFALTEIRFKDDTVHEFREGASNATIAAANFPIGVADVWVPIEISWKANGVTSPLYSVTVGGQTVITDAISTTNGGQGDVASHLAAVANGAMNFQWKYNSNSATSDGLYKVDNIVVFSSDSGSETIIFQDDFEGRITGENLNPDLNTNSPYHENSNDATVGEDF